MSRLFHILLAACCMMTSCSDTCVSDNIVSGSQHPTVSQAILTVTFMLPGDSGSTGVTSDTDGTMREPQPPIPGEENGTAQENRVSSAYVILGEIADGANVPLTIHSVHKLDDLHMTGNHSQWTGRISVSPGHYRVIVIANLDPKIERFVQFNPGDDWMKFIQQPVSLPVDQSAMMDYLWKDNHFLMTNAFLERIEEHDVVLESGKENFAKIYVQRVCARFDYRTKNENNTYTTLVNVDSDGSTETPLTLNVRLTDVAFMNVSNGFFLVKQISPDETDNLMSPHEKENDRNYVVDTDWLVKRLFYHGIFESWRLHEYFYYSSEFHTPLVYRPLSPKVLPEGEYAKIGYVTENTIPGEPKQVNMLSTGLVFKGVFAVPDHITARNLYFYRKNDTQKYLFTTYEALRRFMESTLQIRLPAENVVSDEILAANHVKRFERDTQGNYPVWYTYWNRHRDNRRPLHMGIMEFATVRNNIYKLQINKISNLGLPKDPVDKNNPWKPAGTTPDELGLELEVNLKVSDWVVRDFVHEI